MCFCNPSSLSFHIKPASPSPSVSHSCQLSSARKADEPAPVLQIWPNLLWNRCPGPSSSLLSSPLFVCRNCMCYLPPAKGGRTIDFLGSRQGIQCFTQSLTLRTEVQEPACATTDQTRNNRPVPLRPKMSPNSSHGELSCFLVVSPPPWGCSEKDATDASLAPAMPKWWQFVGKTLRSQILSPAQISASG